jgi:hypothetical protein
VIVRALRNGVVLPGLLVCAAAMSAAIAAPALASTTFRPRIGRAMGLMPIAGTAQDTAQGTPIPVVYHGGSVMSDVTVHTIFWAPSGYTFDGSPGSGVLGYEPLVEQFFGDVAHDSGSTTNIFSLLGQYGDAQGPGHYRISYDAAADSINDTDPYPARSSQCASPSGVSTCLTDHQVTQEIDDVIQRTDPTGRNLHNVWEVLLPTDVDECSSQDACGTNSFAGYHSLANEGHGEFIYAVIIDTLIEGPPIAGADPEGNPEAESAIDTAAHETIEAITNPEGVGWMDPDGFEAADKCEDGPQQGTPLGFAPDGSPYDQLINGHEYEIQEIWSNQTDGCEQSSTVTTDGLPLPSVSLRQFSPLVSGSAPAAPGGVPVQVILFRGSAVVASAITSTRADGSWGPVALSSGATHPALHGVGDDRDVVLVDYDSNSITPELIETGSGGDPFTEAGWTGWFDLDTGFNVSRNSIRIGPCGQTGVLRLTVDGVATAPPISECTTEQDQATVSTPRLTGASALTLSSEDNRAVSILDPSGALVKLTVPLGEPDGVAAISNSQVPFATTGMPSCTADLRSQVVKCDGLVPGARYTLTRSRGHAVRRGGANGSGVIWIANLPGPVPINRGDRLTLTNSAGRKLTVLHVADLRVDINGEQTVIGSGRCQAGDYWGAPLRSLPSSSSFGVGGAAGTGTVCPSSGKAAGLPDAVIAQTDDLSGGLTETSVPLLEGTAPENDAILSGAFTAIAQTGLPGANGTVVPTAAAVSLTITDAAGAEVLHATNVATAAGTAVPTLGAGVYSAKWVVSDLNGDTRTVFTKFIKQG